MKMKGLIAVFILIAAPLFAKDVELKYDSDATGTYGYAQGT